jgi:hypothetical protein
MMSASSFTSRIGSGSSTTSSDGRALSPTVGKRTLVEDWAASAPAAQPPASAGASGLPRVQLKGTGELGRDGGSPSVPTAEAARVAALGGAPAASSGGSALPDGVGSRMERLFGRDFTAVRVHQGPEAAALGARAFTRGNDIHFAPGQYAPETPAGQELLGHELSHVVQQSQGRVAAPQAKGGIVTADASLEQEADEHGARAARGERVAGAGPAGSGSTVAANAPIQPKWLPSPYNHMFYEWDQVLEGLRWYVHKEDDAMYFMVAQVTEQNQPMVRYQQQIKKHAEWLELGFAPLEGADSSVAEEGRKPTMALDNTFQDHDAAPFVYKTESHTVNQKGDFMRDNMEFRQPKKNNEFPKPLGVATAYGHPTGIQAEDNEGKFVFHVTSYRNLMKAPDDSALGIMTVGLQPALGGGLGGACETSQVTANESMVKESQEHSKNRIAVNTGPSNIMLYVNQRLAYNTKQFGEGLYTATDLVERDAILLRFRLTKEHIAAMVIDPKHPKDRHVRLIKNIPVSAHEIEVLTTEGWWPIGKLDPKALQAMMPQLTDFGSQ